MSTSCCGSCTPVAWAMETSGCPACSAWRWVGSAPRWWWWGTYAAFLLGAVLGGLLALARVVDRKGYPFGPFMLVGAFFGVLHAGGDLVFWR